MKILVRTPASLALLVAAALTAGAAAATESAAPPATAMKSAATGAGQSAPPESRLLMSLSERAARPVSAPASTDVRAADPVSGTAAGPVRGEPGSSPVLQGCPRALLNALLAGAAETNDAVAALAIERETLALCRERQEIVNGIVALEGELGTLLAEARAEAAGPVAVAVGSPVADTPTVKESAPVRVVSLPPPTGVAGEAPEKAEAPEVPAPPSYFWFSIIGTAGDLRAGIGDGARVWFVREGDRLPGGAPGSSPVLITGIGTKPPGVRIGGAGEASLPYRPRSVDASLPASGSATLGANAEGEGR